MLQTPAVSVAISHKPGGKLIQVIGRTPARVLRITAAYLAADQIGGQQGRDG